MSLFIESTHNPKIKEVLTLIEKPKVRREALLFVLEGARELTMALEGGYTPQALFYLPQIIPNPCQRFHLPQPFPCYPVSSAVYKKIAYRESTEGVVAMMHQKNLDLSSLQIPSNPLILIIESAEKPGNIGAMLRTADAAQVDAVLVCDPFCDLYNPNLIRASLGALFTLQVVTCSSVEAVSWLQQNEIHIYPALLGGSNHYHCQDYRSGSALVVGSESKGLSPVWRGAECTAIKIPMRGAVDSLNVSVSAAILIFEAIRQREAGKQNMI